MAKLAERLSSSVTDISLSFSYSGGSASPIKVNKGNSMILQKQEVIIVKIILILILFSCPKIYFQNKTHFSKYVLTQLFQERKVLSFPVFSLDGMKVYILVLIARGPGFDSWFRLRFFS